MHPSDPLRGRRPPTFRIGTIAPAAFGLAGVAAFAGVALAMPHGRAGDCFEEMRGRPVYKTVTETVPQAPLVTWRRTPAVWRKEARVVVVRPAHRVYETAPAIYKTVAQTRMIPGPARRISVPAVYRTVEEREEIEAAHLEWRRGAARRGFADDGQAGVTATPTGEVLCRVLVPARYAVSRRQVLVSPAEVREVQGRPRKVICYVKVLVRPAVRIAHEAPAVRRTQMVNRMVKAPGCVKVVTPRPARIIHRQVRVGPGPASWRRLSCGTVHGHGARTPAPAAAKPEEAGERG